MNRRWICGAVCGLAMAAGRTWGQGYGLPVADSAEMLEPGYANFVLGANAGRDVQFYEKFNVMLAGGALVSLTRTVSFFAEVTVTDKAFFGLGLRFQ